MVMFLSRIRRPPCSTRTYILPYSTRCRADRVHLHRVAARRGQLVERRHLGDAGRAPGRPQVDEQRLAPERRQRHRRIVGAAKGGGGCRIRSEEHTSELQSLMRTSYAVFCLKKKNKH